ncbi:hypothetical protein AGMMS50267_05300 [Spirochaetia bacterium]|nr:hypothetical protein AGMMS50267_05300 [Spirochaetia bacterium]
MDNRPQAQTTANAQKAKKSAEDLYPREKWEALETDVFLKIDAHLTRHDVTRKLSGYIERKGYSGGIITVYFTQSGEFYRWGEAELRQKKSGSYDPAAIQGKTDNPKCPR